LLEEKFKRNISATNFIITQHILIPHLNMNAFLCSIYSFKIEKQSLFPGWILATFLVSLGLELFCTNRSGTKSIHFSKVFIDEISSLMKNHGKMAS
jgi:hypothetical protein